MIRLKRISNAYLLEWLIIYLLNPYVCFFVGSLLGWLLVTFQVVVSLNITRLVLFLILALVFTLPPRALSGARQLQIFDEWTAYLLVSVLNYDIFSWLHFNNLMFCIVICTI